MIKTEIVRKHAIMSGRVQGVGFRYRSNYLAKILGITGWVRNMDDGRVGMELQGTSKAINKLFWQLEFSSYVEIEDCDVTIIPLVDEWGFRVVN